MMRKDHRCHTIQLSFGSFIQIAYWLDLILVQFSIMYQYIIITDQRILLSWWRDRDNFVTCTRGNACRIANIQPYLSCSYSIQPNLTAWILESQTTILLLIHHGRNQTQVVPMRGLKALPIGTICKANFWMEYVSMYHLSTKSYICICNFLYHWMLIHPFASAQSVDKQHLIRKGRSSQMRAQNNQISPPWSASLGYAGTRKSKRHGSLPVRYRH